LGWNAHGNIAEPFPSCAFGAFEQTAGFAGGEKIRGHGDVLLHHATIAVS
jgi:hypothetical protein